MDNMKKILILIILNLVLLFAANQSFAKLTNIRGGTRTPGFSTRPELGVQKGSFLIYPQMNASLEYNDNIYATKDDTESDEIIHLQPRILAASLWPCHCLKLAAGIDKGFYMDNSDEDYLDAHVLTDGQIDIDNDSFIETRLGFENYYEDRGSPDSQKAWDEPARYNRWSGGAWLNHTWNRLFGRAGGDVFNYKFKDVDLVDGGSQSLDSRDRNEYDAVLRLGYEWMPDVKPFVEGQYVWRRYDKENLSQRDSDGYRIGAGTQVYLGGVTTGEVFGGYLNQSYDYDQYDDISGFWYGLSLLWEATKLTSIKTSVEERVDETTQLGASGIVATDVSINLDHELRRDTSIGFEAGYTHDDYEGVDLVDQYYRIGPFVMYHINRNLNANLRYDFTTRNSNEDEPNREYDVNKLFLGITGTY
jgi:hypothetical protein